MRSNPSYPDEPDAAPRPQRLFLHEPGWHIGLKVGSEREFCYTMAPGQDFYHRLLDGEIYLFRPEERICLACAVRRGLITGAAKGLRESISALAFDTDDSTSAFELRVIDDADWSL